MFACRESFCSMGSDIKSSQGQSATRILQFELCWRSWSRSIACGCHCYLICTLFNEQIFTRNKSDSAAQPCSVVFLSGAKHWNPRQPFRRISATIRGPTNYKCGVMTPTTSISVRANAAPIICIPRPSQIHILSIATVPAGSPLTVNFKSTSNDRGYSFVILR